jgi:hypothetical protein
MYRLYRICERFSQPVSYLDTLDRRDLVNLLAYDAIRQDEEIQIMTAMIPRI